MEFGHNGGTIGRSLESDWVLPDGQRYLSSRHASIDFRSGSYYVVDTSTNGVYVNDAETPVGRGNPQRLFTGDRVRIGEYEMSVEITDEDDTRETLVNDQPRRSRLESAARAAARSDARRHGRAARDHGRRHRDADRAKTPRSARSSATTKANVANLRLEDDAPRAKRNRKPSRRPPPSPPSAAEPAPAAPLPKRAEPPPVSAGRAHRAAPALRAPKPHINVRPGPAVVAAHRRRRLRQHRVRAPHRSTRSSAAPACPPNGSTTSKPSKCCTASGNCMREVVLGVTENLHLRAEQKNVMRVPTTTIQPQNNNPLKFSASVEEALNNLLFRESAEYLSAVDAVRETFGDIKQHQQHLLAAVRTAVADYVGRLDPEELESKISNGRHGALMQAANKLKYWDLFKDLYQVVSQHQPGQFPHQFLEELARAYEHEESRSTPAGGAARQAKLG